jgi:hypothetical protein
MKRQGRAADWLAPMAPGGSYARPNWLLSSFAVIRPFLVALLALPLCAGPALAQPQPLPFENTIPAARDVPYPGTMKLVVDATDLDRRIMTVKQTIPVAGPGPMVLLYPEWLPGKHGPRGELEKVAGLKITAGGKTRAWRRDPVEVFALHIDVPAGAKQVELSFQFLSATAADQGRVVMTREMLNLQWNQAAFYPAGWFTRQIPVEATAILPEGWGYGVALPPRARATPTSSRPSASRPWSTRRCSPAATIDSSTSIPAAAAP